jgi:hypothetical protein
MENKPKIKVLLIIHAESCPSLYAVLEGLSPRKRAGLLRSYGEVHANHRAFGGLLAQSTSIPCPRIYVAPSSQPRSRLRNWLHNIIGWI